MYLFQNLSLRTRSFLLISILLFTLFAIETIQEMANLHAVEHMILEERSALARTVAQDLDRNLKENLTRLVLISKNPKLNLMDSDMEPEKEVLQIFRDPNQNKYVFILDKDGKVLLTEPFIPEIIGSRQMMDCPHVQNTLKTGQPDIVCINDASTFESSVIAPIVPIYNDLGQIVGVLGVAIDPSSTDFSGLLQKAVHGLDVHAQVIDEDGKVLAHTQEHSLFQRSAYADLFIPLVQNKQAFVTTQQVVEDGKTFRSVIAFAPLFTASWGVAIEQPEAVLMAPVNEVRHRTLYFSIGAIIIAILVAWISISNIVGPIRGLLNASQRFTSGDFSAPMQIKGKDEIAELGHSFETMRQRLASWSNEMEDAVQMRTQELSEYKNILNNLNDHVMVIDHQYRITNVNQPFLKITGFQHKEVIGKHCYEISHHSAIPCWQCGNEQHRCPSFEVWQTGNSARAVHLHYNAVGEPIWIDLIASPLLDNNGNTIAVVEACRDITIEKSRATLLTNIFTLSTELATIRDENNLLEILVTRGAFLAGSSTFTVMMIDDKNKEAVMLASNGLSRESNGLHVPLDLHIFRQFMDDGKPIIISDIDRYAPKLRTVLVRKDIQSFFVYPMTRKEGRPLGFITMSKMTPYMPSEDEITAYQLLAERAGAALENARLYKDVKEISIATIRSLAAAIDARDTYTRGHSEEVANLALQTGKRLGWNSLDLELLEFAALLHDVGKIAVPDNILFKVAPLSTEEWSILRAHAYYSAQIIRPIRSMEQIIPWVYHHHERWDGKGYLDGLKGEEIPLASRIIAVADSYNAMTTDRPYRKKLSQEEAVKELESNAGTQFDPHVIEIFLQLITQLYDPNKDCIPAN